MINYYEPIGWIDISYIQAITHMEEIITGYGTTRISYTIYMKFSNSPIEIDVEYEHDDAIASRVRNYRVPGSDYTEAQILNMEARIGGLGKAVDDYHRLLEDWKNV